MGKKEENAGFSCIHCQRDVSPIQSGSYRNHCPFCLVSLHVDQLPGDRKNCCHGIMIAKQVIYNSKKGWQLIHECQVCKETKANIVAQDDDWQSIIRLTVA